MDQGMSTHLQILGKELRSIKSLEIDPSKGLDLEPTKNYTVTCMRQMEVE